MSNEDLSTRIDAVLPQTQCARCGFDGCRPYARALAAGAVDLDRCPPGGDEVVVTLAALTGRPRKPLDPTRGAHGPLLVAVIDEAACIGCTLCIDACPVDAIIGAQRRMHAVLPSLCSGCERCVLPCPVDCIRMVSAGRAWTADDAAAARTRHDTRALRLARRAKLKERKPAADAQRAARRYAVGAALARARARRSALSP
jgi:H+/Na+-translocating ferredoxin:NAD+ oxidoreductase subunit B